MQPMSTFKATLFLALQMLPLHTGHKTLLLSSNILCILTGSSQCSQTFLISFTTCNSQKERKIIKHVLRLSLILLLQRNKNEKCVSQFGFYFYRHFKPIIQESQDRRDDFIPLFSQRRLKAQNIDQKGSVGSQGIFKLQQVLEMKRNGDTGDVYGTAP